MGFVITSLNTSYNIILSQLSAVVTYLYLYQVNCSQELVECPICFKSVSKEMIEEHADSCADNTSTEVLEMISSQEKVAR